MASRKQAYTARRLRPLARRAAITARPPRVFMRVKKPCVRARLTLEGWYVRFMMVLQATKLPLQNPQCVVSSKNRLRHDLQNLVVSGKPMIIADFPTLATS
jgi:hypothetical protein